MQKRIISLIVMMILLFSASRGFTQQEVNQDCWDMIPQWFRNTTGVMSHLYTWKGNRGFFVDGCYT